MRALTLGEVASVSGGDYRGLVVGVGRVAGMGLGYGLCLPCGGLGTTFAVGIGGEVGGQLAGYTYDHPVQVARGVLTTMVAVDTMSTAIGWVHGSALPDDPARQISW